MLHVTSGHKNILNTTKHKYYLTWIVIRTTVPVEEVVLWELLHSQKVYLTTLYALHVTQYIKHSICLHELG